MPRYATAPRFDPRHPISPHLVYLLAGLARVDPRTAYRALALGITPNVIRHHLVRTRLKAAKNILDEINRRSAEIWAIS